MRQTGDSWFRLLKEKNSGGGGRWISRDSCMCVLISYLYMSEQLRSTLRFHYSRSLVIQSGCPSWTCSWIEQRCQSLLPPGPRSPARCCSRGSLGTVGLEGKTPQRNTSDEWKTFELEVSGALQKFLTPALTFTRRYDAIPAFWQASPVASPTDHLITTA